MTIHAIGPTGSARIDDVLDAYRAERMRAEALAQRRTEAKTLAPAFAHCLKLAMQVVREQQAALEARSIEVNRAEQKDLTMLQVRAEAANDLGTIQGLTPLQQYRYAAGVPVGVPVVTKRFDRG